MKTIFNSIERQCNMGFCIQISGIGFELMCQRNRGKNICDDILHYIPEQEEQKANNKNVKLYYIVSNEIFEKMTTKVAQSKSRNIIIYHTRSVYKGAKHYSNKNIDVFFCEQEPYYICTVGDKIYTILTEHTKSINRLYFRIMVEVVLRAKEMMGYHLIHAACVSVDGKGILISGGKGAGKTTLMSHFLNNGESSFVANDKVFISPNLTRIEYFPMVARVGEGTLQKFEKYNLRNEYHRITEEEKRTFKDNYGNDKWEFTPKEIVNIFSCNYKDNEKLDLLLLPKIREQEEELLLPDEANVLDFDIFAEKEKRVPNWLLNDSWIEYFSKNKNKKNEQCNKEYQVYKLHYGYEVKSNNIMKMIKNIFRRNESKVKEDN